MRKKRPAPKKKVRETGDSKSAPAAAAIEFAKAAQPSRNLKWAFLA